MNVSGTWVASKRSSKNAENISYHVAAGDIDKELLGEWMIAVLTDNVDEESLKLRLLQAMMEGNDDAV